MPLLSFLRANAAFLLAGALLSFTSSYGQTFFISVFAGEIRADFGLTDGQWGGIYTLGTTISALVMIWSGALTDVFRTRHLALIVMPGLALACIGMFAVQHVALLVVVIFALRIMGQGMMHQLAVVSMARWFVGKRGTALSIASMGVALGQAILPLIFVALMGWIDWRLLWLVAAGLVLAVIPVILRLLRLERTPQSIAQDSEVTGMAGRHWTRGEVLRTPLFWLLVPALLGPPAWGTALFFQQVHLTEVKGWALGEFVALLPLFTLVLVLTNFASGLAVDRFGAGRVVSLQMIPCAAGFLVLAMAPTIAWAALGMALYATGQGMAQTAVGAFWAEYFGTRFLGAIKAAAAAIMVFGSAIGPGVTGYLIDWGIDFPAQMFGISAYFAVAAALAALGIARARNALAATA